MIKFFIENKELITVLLGIIIGFIPTVFEIKNKTEKKSKLTIAGYFFILFVVSLISLSIFTVAYENGNLTQDKISINFSLRANKTDITEAEINKLLPNQIPTYNIRFGEAQTSGIFRLKKTFDGKSHSFPSKFAEYNCDNLLVTDIENFPKRIEELAGTSVTINFPMSNFWKDFSINSQPTLKIDGKEYNGEIYEDKIYFNIK
ncbi:hypothetical protein [Flavobacterium quisquiliarum]|jgi:hypothetical protein|uniref:Uncharacterized protein n=1 Tax=Flavobacterium quisquiliarum TaxID=1834436 RepID=A0ABV8WAH2_9FLAO|nr:hypothetical protein [Flavobacterium quisquiliarum]MBW1656481.1 hypothetical protein [Flavobacterium quisquiliarum]NWL03850.1 hypothetical protein [Flavobacterium collinsii]